MSHGASNELKLLSSAMSHGASNELEGYLKPSQTSTRQHSCENSELFHRKKELHRRCSTMF